MKYPHPKCIKPNNNRRKKCRKQYNRQLDALKQERDQTIEQRTVQYDKHLDVFQRRLTQAGKIDDALNVHAERERVRVKTSR